VRESRYPFSLNTGRLRDQWHGMSRTGTLGRLFGHVPGTGGADAPAGHGAPAAGRRRPGARDSKRGSIVVPVQASTDIGLSQAFIAMHWGEEYLSGCSSTGTRLAGVNALTTSASCPTSKQPELKHAAVKIVKAELPWSVLAMAWLPDAVALRSREQLRGLMGAFPFASCVPFGRERTGLLFRAAAHEAPPPEVLAQIEVALQLDGHAALRYNDPGRGQRRVAGWRASATTSGSKASCWPATSAPRPGSARCCRTSCRRRPMAACCCRLRPPRRWPCSSAAARSAPASTCARTRSRPCCSNAPATTPSAWPPAGQAAVRHQLRLLRARAEAPGALGRGAATHVLRHTDPTGGSEPSGTIPRGHQPVHQGNRPRQAGRAAARPRPGADLFGQLLDGGVSDLEVGAFCIAMRIKGETPEEMAASSTPPTPACSACRSASGKPVVVPAQLQRRAPPAGAHPAAGAAARAPRPAGADPRHGDRIQPHRRREVLQPLGIQGARAVRPSRRRGGLRADEVLLPRPEAPARRAPRHRPAQQSHSLVKLMNPCAGPAVVVGSYTHPEYAVSMAAVYELMGATALLLRGTEGEVVADARRLPQMDGFVRGRRVRSRKASGHPDRPAGLAQGTDPSTPRPLHPRRARRPPANARLAGCRWNTSCVWLPKPEKRRQA
jgi:hypothetical protein